ncbi:MAG TPA: LTA synthase family protein [Gemmatimonadaceae bacterium]|nr:LTA synthase family protein [Gemmatimonadaceae bacterium]
MTEEANAAGETRDTAPHARQLAGRMVLIVVLALASTRALRIVLAPLLRPAGWSDYYYLRLLLPIALVAAWTVVLLPRDTRALVQRVRTNETLAPVAALGVLLVAAAALVSASDLAFQLVRSGSIMQSRLAIEVIDWRAWLTTTAILFAVLALVFAMTSSAAASVLLVAPLYLTMMFATLMKIRYMHSAVQPLDLLSLPEFMPLFASFFGMFAVVTCSIAFVLWLAALVVACLRWRTRLTRGLRATIGVVALAPLLVLTMVSLPSSRLPGPVASHRDRLFSIMKKLGMPGEHHREMARVGGILLNFVSELPSTFVEAPRGYSPERAASTLQRYGAARSAGPTRAGGVNLVIYLVESLMDPNDLGLRFTSEPMPNLRALQREQVGGYGIVPETFGGSANGEFEVLSGMTTSFLPTRSLAYRQYVRHPIDALPRTLRDMGYASIAVTAGPRYYYDRERVYPLLGFERTDWLFGAPGIARGDRGNWPPDDAVVDAVIKASEQKRPFFVFAFPASSHAPYDYGTYRGSDLDVLGAPSSLGAAEAKEYVNAVRVADRSIGRLIEYFRGRSDSTVIAIVGDHMPPLKSDAVRDITERAAGLPPAEQTRALLRVPLLVWANFRLPHEETTLSLNLLPAYLLERIGVPRTGLFAIADSVRHVLPVAGTVVQDASGRLWLPADVPAQFRGLLDDYRLVQHDMLLGQPAMRSER